MPRRFWPAADETAFARGLAPGRLLEPGGPGGHWRPGTVRHATESYGGWLAWLQREGLLDPRQSPGARCTAERVAAYACWMRQRRLAPATVVTRLVGLERALYAMGAAARTRVMIRRLVAALPAPTPARGRKRSRLQDVRRLAALGRQLMEEARTATHLKPLVRALLFRDGLMIALLAAVPLRRRNLTALAIGRHLVREDGRWRIKIPESETKNHRPLNLPVPRKLAPDLEAYLDGPRTYLATRDEDELMATDALWISARRGPLTARRVRDLLCEHTERAFGRHVNPHLFRDCAATSIAIRDPKRVRIAAAVLGHASFAVTQKHYNLAQAYDAALAAQASLQQLGRELML